MNERPLVSIGVAVFNEERYLDLTLRSLLSQDYPNLEVIISDNASTDRTPEIYRQAASNDPRIRYFRADVNEGAVKNFNTAFHHARGKYFMWAGAHDLWEPSFISKSVALLESDSQIILAYPRTMVIDQHGEHQTIAPDQLDTRGFPALKRYLTFIWNVHWCNMIHGLIRSDVIRSTGIFRPLWGADILLLAELSLIGEFAQIPEVLFFRRENRPEVDETKSEEWKQRYLKTMEGTQTTEQRNQSSLPDLFRELRNALLKVLSESDLTYHRKVRARLETVICFRVRYGVRFPSDSVWVNGTRVARAAKRLTRLLARA